MPARTKKDAFLRDLLAQPFSQEWAGWLWENLTHYRLLSDLERSRLHDDARVLMAAKSWEGCDGLKVTEIMKLTVSAQAALLLLGLDHDYFSRVLSIVLFPTEFELPAETWEVRGTIVAGQAVDYGTVFLSWATVLTEARDPLGGHNLVIHEFAHQLDFLDGYTNGVPALRTREQSQRWQQVMHGTFNRLRRDLQKGRKTFLGAYAASHPAEFFSVASEKFFTVPRQLQERHSELFDVLTEYYGVDPLQWFEGLLSPTLSSEDSQREEETTGVCLAAPEQTEALNPEPANESDVGSFEPDAESDFVDFKCPYCKNPISFPKADAGTLKQCPTCLDSMIVPPSSGSSAERIPFPIRTERLVLRRLQTIDAQDLTDLMANAENLRFVEWNPMTLEQVEEWIANQGGVQFPHSTDCCYLALEAVAPAKVIGLITFWFVHEFDLAQFEIIIHPKSQRKGYAREALRGLLAYAFTGLRTRRIIAECDTRNLPARHLLLQAGLRQESECIQDRFLKSEWINTLGFALLKQEYFTP